MKLATKKFKVWNFRDFPSQSTARLLHHSYAFIQPFTREYIFDGQNLTSIDSNWLKLSAGAEEDWKVVIIVFLTVPSLSRLKFINLKADPEACKISNWRGVRCGQFVSNIRLLNEKTSGHQQAGHLSPNTRNRRANLRQLPSRQISRLSVIF